MLGVSSAALCVLVRAPAIDLEIVSLGISGLGTWRKQAPSCYEKRIWHPIDLMIGLLRSSALQMTGTSSPSFCSAELLRGPILSAIGGQIVFVMKALFLLFPCTQSSYTQSYDL